MTIEKTPVSERAFNYISGLVEEDEGLVEAGEVSFHIYKQKGVNDEDLIRLEAASKGEVKEEYVFSDSQIFSIITTPRPIIDVLSVAGEDFTERDQQRLLFIAKTIRRLIKQGEIDGEDF